MSDFRRFWIALGAVLLLGACAENVGERSAGGGSARPGLSVAEAALSGGSPQVALQVVSGILERSPNDATALAVRGDALTNLGRLDDAVTSYEQALRQDATQQRALIGLGRVRLTTDPAAAESLFDRALRGNPRDTAALNNLGIARDLQGKRRDAQDAYRQALGIDPNLTAAQVNLALSLALNGQSDAALRIIGPKAAEPGASRKIRHDYAAILAMAGRRAEAERILSADLTADEVKQALDAYVSARMPVGPIKAEPPVRPPLSTEGALDRKR
jgi:Flp pilus assembly protein TadD